eukprot:2522395-Rhodomonas_salina.1
MRFKLLHQHAWYHSTRYLSTAQTPTPTLPQYPTLVPTHTLSQYRTLVPRHALSQNSTSPRQIQGH